MNETEYHKILFELGILDEENWELYKLQEAQFDIEDELYCEYVKINYTNK